MKQENGFSISSISSVLIKIISNTKNTIIGVYDFILGAISLAQNFAEYNFERIIKAVFLFLSLLLVQVNPYVSLLLAVGYLIYEVDIYIKQEIAAVKDVNVQKEQQSKWELLAKLPGYFHYQGTHAGSIFERLSQEVYRYCREKPGNRDSLAFVKYLENLGYNAPKHIINSKDTGINTVITTHTKNRDLLVLTGGTDFFAFDKTLFADLDHAGPGREVFLKHRDLIINPILEESRGLDYINLAGHSFGGAISMMLAVELMKTIKEKKLSIKSINVSIYQSAGVNAQVAQEANDILKELEVTYPDFSLNMVSHYHDYDPIPGSGRQILSDYRGSNAKVFVVRRHLTFRGFLTIVASPGEFIDLVHKGDIYDRKDSGSENDLKKRALKRGSVTQIYHDEGYNEESSDRQFILNIFLSTHTKFVCNETMYHFFTRHEPLVWKTVIIGGISALCLFGSILNLGYVLFVPGVLNFYNFYTSLSAPLLTYYCFCECYDELLESRSSESGFLSTGDATILRPLDVMALFIGTDEVKKTVRY